MSYRGESPAKKLARVYFWQAVSDMLGRRFASGPHVVLASSEAGDVSCLLGMGVPSPSIIAVDNDKHAAAAAQWRFPFVDVRYENVVTTLGRMETPPASVFLDLMAPLSKSWLTLVHRVLDECDAQTVIGLTFLSAREQNVYGRRVQTQLVKGLKGLDARIEVLKQSMSDFAATSKSRRFHPKQWIYYVSHSDERFGMPMGVAIGHSGVSRPIRKSKQNWHKLPRKVFQYDPGSFAKYATRLHDKQDGRALLLLNMKATNMAAWRAHLTRETYE